MKQTVNLIFIFLAIFLINCNDKDPLEISTELSTNPISNITISTAESGGSIFLSGNIPIISRGVCWNKHGNPNISDSFTISTQKTDTFTCTITGLNKNDIYYVKAFVTIKNDTIYGDEIEFNSLEVIDGETIQDIDGNTYKTVKIGNQYWMAENLKVTHYRNGDAIPNIKADSIWSEYDTGYRCYYDNDSTKYANEYGALYNNFAVKDPRNICPDGWHIPSYEEWQTLLEILGDSAHIVMKSTENWDKNIIANNYIGFSALPYGIRGSDGLFGHFTDNNNSATWWSSHELGYPILLEPNLVSCFYTVDPRLGISVRCIKD